MTTYHNGLAFTDDAQHVCLNSLPADYHTLTYPTISGVAAGRLRANANTGALVELRYTLLNEIDDVTAAARMVAGYPDCRLLMPGDPPEIVNIESGARYLYIMPCAYGGTDTTPANGIVDSSTVTNDNGGATVGGVAAVGITSAQILAVTPTMTRCDLLSADDVRQVAIRFGATYDSGKRAVIEIEGVSYAQ